MKATFLGRRAALAVLLVMGLTAVTVAPAGATQVSEPLIEDLVGPLGLAVGDDGTIYVAEAFAGQLTSVDPRGRRQVLYGSEGASVAGVDVAGRGHVVFTETVFPEDDGESETRLARVQPDGTVRTIASLSNFEQEVNPDGDQWYGFLDLDEECLEELPDWLHPYQGIVESNPYAVRIHRGGYLVADAAGNTILRVTPNGRVSVVAVLEPVPQEVTEDVAEELAEFGIELPDCVIGETYHGEPVPTDVEVGPDGAYYVTLLPGLPEVPGGARVVRIDPRTGAQTIVADGLSSAVDLAVAPDGTIYVAELFVSRISTIAGGDVVDTLEVPFPGALEIGRDGALYAAIDAVTLFFDGETMGSVVRINP